MLGTIVNFIAIIVGSVIGIVLKKGIPERYKDTIMQGIGLATFLIGLKMGFKANNELIVILSLVLGGILGEILSLIIIWMHLVKLCKKELGRKMGIL